MLMLLTALTYQARTLVSAVVDEALAHLLIHMRAVVVGAHLRRTHTSQHGAASLLLPAHCYGGEHCPSLSDGDQMQVTSDAAGAGLTPAECICKALQEREHWQLQASETALCGTIAVSVNC